MLWYGFSGAIDFGTGDAYFVNIRIWIFIIIGIFAVSHLFFGKNWKIRIYAALVSFGGVYVGFMALSATFGMFDAMNTGVFRADTFWILFSMNTSAYADLTVGLNAKLIADSICYLIPAFTLVIIIFQMLYAGEADEFIKAFIEGLAIIIFLIAYSLVGGVQVAL